MSEVNPVNITDKYANYTAVKIRINEPKALISGKGEEAKGNYNAVDIAVDKPIMAKYDHQLYNYPQNENPITGEMAIQNTEQYYPIAPIATYKNDITNENIEKQADAIDNHVIEEQTVVPEPNVTTPEEEKKTTIQFNGTKKPVEIAPAQNILPNIDINDTLKKLSDKNYDVQASQMDIITKTALKNTDDAIAYINKPVFNALIKILKQDTSKLNKPSEEQMEIRKKIIINEMVQQKAEQEGKKDVKSPFTLTKDEIKTAMILSDYEQAERNKEYAMYTIAALDKIYINETEKRTGNVLPLTDLPGVPDIVDTLKTDNANTKLIALESLYYIKRPEYKEELKAIYSMASTDENPMIAKVATEMVNATDK